MKERTDEECKSLVYLMLTRYNDNWQERFPTDMRISPEDCQALYDAYADIVRMEIEKAKLSDTSVPTVEELITLGMKRLRATMQSSDDPSKIARSIEMLNDLPDSKAIKRTERKTMFDIIQDKAKGK